MTKQQLGDITLERFTEALQNDEKINELMEKVKDAHKTVAKVYGEKPTYSVVNAMNIVKTRLKNSLAIAGAIEVEAMVVGNRDKKGASFPIQYALLAQEGKHFAVKRFDTKVPDADGKMVIIPPFGVVRAKIVKNEEFGGWDWLQVSALKSFGDDVSRITAALQEGIGILPLNKVPDVPRKPKTYPLVVFKCKIKHIRSTSNFQDEERTPWPVLVDGVPVIWIVSEAEDKVDANITLEAREKTTGASYLVDDLIEAATEAVESSDDPVQQAKYLDGIFSGKEIIVVGQISSVAEGPSDWVDWRVNIAAFAIIEVQSGLNIETKTIDGKEGDVGQKRMDQVVEVEEEETKEKVEEEVETKPIKKPSKAKTSKVKWVEDENGPVATEQPSPAEKEVLPQLKLLADVLGVTTIGDIDIEALMKGRNLKELATKFTPEVVKAIWEDHKTDKVEG